MNSVDNTKQELLDIMNSMANLDPSKLPAFVFLKLLSREMVALGLPADVIRKSLTNFTIDLSGLGEDVEPHMPWLVKMSKAYAEWINKTHSALEKEFGFAACGDLCSKGLSLKLP